MKKYMMYVIGAILLISVIVILNNPVIPNGGSNKGIFATDKVNFVDNNKGNLNEDNLEGIMSPFIEFEGTVSLLSLEKDDMFYEGGVLIRAPKDNAYVKVDKIIDVGGSYYDWSSIGMEVGKEASLIFKYGVRPLKLVTKTGVTSTSGDLATQSNVPTEYDYSEGYYIVTVNGADDSILVLPGLKVGQKFRAKIWEQGGVEVVRYELI